mmetsp:Transcript_10683/g.16757  ORF Transcript_10683/g.16757 Transcript_10683/m.16757 type:complete len:494 (-) Transcript_10683:19-1500(-)
MEMLGFQGGTKDFAKEFSMMMNTWAPYRQGTHEEQVKTAEAERLAASQDAKSFFARRDDDRSLEYECQGTAHHPAVRAARCRPWGEETKRDLSKAGIGGPMAQKAVLEYEPRLVVDPNYQRHLEECWEKEVHQKHIHSATLARQGWLTLDGMRRWITLRRNQGLSWSRSEKDQMVGFMLFDDIAGIYPDFREGNAVLIVKGDNRPKSAFRRKSPFSGQRVRLFAHDEEEAKSWCKTLRRELETFKHLNGVGYLQHRDVVIPEEEIIVLLPEVDDNELLKERLCIFHVKVGDEVYPPQLLVEVEKSSRKEKPFEIRAGRRAIVQEICWNRLDGATGDPYVRIGDPVVKMSREAIWKEGADYLPSTGVGVPNEVAARKGLFYMTSGAPSSKPSSQASRRTEDITNNAFPKILAQTRTLDVDGFWRRHCLSIPGSQFRPPSGGGLASKDRRLSPTLRLETNLTDFVSDNYAINTIRQRYSSDAIAAASKILLSSKY